MHLEPYIKSMKLSLFKRILPSTDAQLNTHFGVIIKGTASKCLQMGSDYPIIFSKNTHNIFLGKNHYRCEYIVIVQKALNIHQTELWFNPQIKLDKKSIFFLSIV